MKKSTTNAAGKRPKAVSPPIRTASPDADAGAAGDVARFLALPDTEKEAVFASLDRDIPAAETRPTTAADKARWRRVAERARGPGRPKVGQGAERINVTVERSLLKRADAFAKKHDLTRAELIARGLWLAIM